jgi:hypothetical protein
MKHEVLLEWRIPKKRGLGWGNSRVASHFKNIILFREKKHKVKVTMNLDILRSQGHRRGGILKSGNDVIPIWRGGMGGILFLHALSNQDETMWYNLPKLTCYEHNGPSCHWPKYIKPHVQVIHPNEMRLIVKKSTKNISINFQRKKSP